MEIVVVKIKPRKARKVPLRKLRAFKKPKWKFKKSELNKLDSHFSRKIRLRDGRCMFGGFPGCSISDISKLQCSHYEGRQRWETRFDENNCIALCMFHHFMSKLYGYEFQKQREELHGFDGQYTKRMKELLGETAFWALITKEKQSRKDAMENYKQDVENSPLTKPIV